MRAESGNDRKASVAICMATYNGEKYLQEQLESLYSQSYQDFDLIIHDDGSTDRTMEVLSLWKKKMGAQMILLDDGVVFHNSSENFAHILAQIEKKGWNYDYYMFSDQDDVWKKDKIEVTLHTMKIACKKNPGPTLVHTDLEVVDENLNSIASSYMKYRSINPRIVAVNRMLIQNNVTGCTMMWNASLNQQLCWEKVNPAMHDWWISLTACLIGHTVFLNRATILYRQHGKNVVGATKVNSLSFIKLRLSNLRYVRNKFCQSVAQAKSIYKIYGKACSPQDREYLVKFSKLYEMGKFQRLYRICKYGFFKQSVIQVIGEILFI